MSRFTERLWRDLVREHGADLAQVTRPAGHGRLARPRLLAGTTAGLAGVGSAVALVMGTAGTAPAFAVSQNRDGTVSVVVRRLAALPDANARLAKLGFRARFVQVAPGCAAPPPAVRAALFARQAGVGAVQVLAGSVHAQFDPKQIPPGRTLMMRAWREGHEIKVSAARVVRGAVPPCFGQAVARTIHGGVVRGAPGGAVRCFLPASSPSGSGNSGDSGNSGPPPAGNSGPFTGGNSGNSGNSGSPAAGNSGPPVSASSGNSRNSGNSGNSGAPTGAAATPGHEVLPCPAWSRATRRAATAARAAAAADARRAKTRKH